MKTGIYLSLREDESLHTIIIKKEIGKFTYMAAVGYAGGQVYGEFYGKFWSEPDAAGQVHAVGYFSGSTNQVQISKGRNPHPQLIKAPPPGDGWLSIY